METCSFEKKIIDHFPHKIRICIEDSFSYDSPYACFSFSVFGLQYFKNVHK